MVLNIVGGGWGGKAQNVGGGAMGAKLFAGCKQSGAPAPQSVPKITFLTL